MAVRGRDHDIPDTWQGEIYKQNMNKFINATQSQLHNRKVRAVSFYLAERIVAMAGPAGLDHEEGEEPDPQDPGQAVEGGEGEHRQEGAAGQAEQQGEHPAQHEAALGGEWISYRFQRKF